MEDESSKKGGEIAEQSPTLGTALLDAARRDAQQLAIRECWELIQILSQSGVLTIDSHQLKMIQEALQQRLDALVNPTMADPDDRLPTS